ncbi:MAG: hypothetical protein KDA37_17300, partial [Planctomycetales bacterium]|nr:hypothetical protein [Planctomycetales bacterium]
MRRFPCSWDTTLAALGFKRKVRKQRDHRYRSSRVEQLEVRALLSVSPAPLSEEEQVQVASATGAEAPLIGVVQSVAEYVFADANNAQSIGQFHLTTEYNPAGQPVAVLTLRDDLPRVDTSLHELHLELRSGSIVLARHEVLIDIAEPEFRETFVIRRIDKASTEVAQASAATARQWLGQIDSEGRFADLR